MIIGFMNLIRAGFLAKLLSFASFEPLLNYCSYELSSAVNASDIFINKFKMSGFYMFVYWIVIQQLTEGEKYFIWEHFLTADNWTDAPLRK